MDTKEQIIESANKLLVERGFNAFSFKNISKDVGIKTSSIHYHFPTKTELGIAVLQTHVSALQATISRTKNKTAVVKLSTLFLYYKLLANEKKVCVVGALTSDINTLEEPLRQELLKFSTEVVGWAITILEQGQQENTIRSFPNTELKAKMLVANLMALVQVARIEQNPKSFDQMTQLMLNELLIQPTE